MIKIRNNVFETNSSSSHSLVYEIDALTGEPCESKINYHIGLYDFYGDDPEKGILAVYFGNYGWEGDPCDSFRRKLSYLLTQTVAGYGLEYYGNQFDENSNIIEGEESIKISTQDQWDEVIEKYVLKDPAIIKILNLIKEKCPNIKGFKFYWYDPSSWEMEDAYKRYYDLKYDDKIEYKLTDKFFYDYLDDFSGDKYLIGFGSIDHQSGGLLYKINYLEKYLFDDNFKVIITNDNR